MPEDASRSGEGEIVEGRFILNTAVYALPKDEQETNRLDQQHVIVQQVFQGKNYRAPIQKPRAILDVGTGTGRWALEMARAFPDARVVGCDLAEAKTSEEAGLAPGNYQYVQGDVLKGLPFTRESFDFIHQRFLTLAIPGALWQQEVTELMRLTAPGGWVELVETQLQVLNPGPIGQRYTDMIREASLARGMDTSYPLSLSSLLQSAGFINVEEVRVDVPIGAWGGELGTLLMANLLAGTQAVRPLVVSLGLMTAQEYDQNLSLLPREWQQHHSVLPFYVAYGQREG